MVGDIFGAQAKQILGVGGRPRVELLKENAALRSTTNKAAQRLTNILKSVCARLSVSVVN